MQWDRFWNMLQNQYINSYSIGIPQHCCGCGDDLRCVRIISDKSYKIPDDCNVLFTFCGRNLFQNDIIYDIRFEAREKWIGDNSTMIVIDAIGIAVAFELLDMRYAYHKDAVGHYKLCIWKSYIKGSQRPKWKIPFGNITAVTIWWERGKYLQHTESENFPLGKPVTAQHRIFKHAFGRNAIRYCLISIRWLALLFRVFLVIVCEIVRDIFNCHSVFNP